MMRYAKNFLNRKVLLAFGTLLFVAATVAGFTGAFFSDEEQSNNNVFQAGTLDLEVGIDSNSTLGNKSLSSLTGNEALFNFQGLIPGETDSGFFKLESNVDAWACMATDVTGTLENDRLDPEESAGDTTSGITKGELQNFMQLATWLDIDEDGAYDDTIDTELQVMDLASAGGDWMPLMDSSNPGGEFLVKNVRGEVGFQYCFGEFNNPNNPAAGCDGSNPDTNQAQTDSVELSLNFIGMQHANNPSFLCGSLNPEIVVMGADLATTPGEVLGDMTKWLFYNDTTDTIMTPNEFSGSGGVNDMVAGVSTPFKGTGSAQMTLHDTSARYNIATYQFNDVKLGDLTDMKFAAYATTPVGSGPYLHFNVDFDNSDTWQSRLVYVPGDNYTVSADTWGEYDAIDGGSAMWRYSGATWPGTTDAGTVLKSWSDIMTLYPNAETRSTDSFFGIRVGQPGPAAYTGYVDYVSFDGQVYNFEN